MRCNGCHHPGALTPGCHGRCAWCLTRPPSTALQGAIGKEGTGTEAASGDEEDDEDGEDEELEGRAKEKAGTGKGAVGAAVLAMLQKVAEEQAVEIAQVCRCARHKSPSPRCWCIAVLWPCYQYGRIVQRSGTACVWQMQEVTAMPLL